MGLIDTLKRVFGLGRPELRRSVATIAAEGDQAAEQATEVVSTKAEPIKPGHLRLTHRDPRLLPKPKPKPVRAWPPPKRQRYMDREEADRLFAATMRTRDRRIRDLAADEQQLERYGLPVWRSEAELAEALGLTVKRLRYFSIHRERETAPHYVRFAVKKRSGGTRVIHAPKRELKAVLRRLNGLLVTKLPVSEFAHGFISGRSVKTNADPHVGKAVVLKFDLRDCFPSIHFGRVRGLLIAMGYSYPVAATLAVLMTEADRQPVEAEGETYHVPTGPRYCVQGAPTSPALCNAVLLRLDRRLAGAARHYGYDYTRYADDLTFSGDDPSRISAMMSLVNQIVREEGFSLRRDKTRVLRSSQRQRVTGVVVNQDAGLSRKQRRRLRAEIHQISKSDEPVDSTRLKQLRGMLSYLSMLNAEQAEPLIKALDHAEL